MAVRFYTDFRTIFGLFSECFRADCLDDCFDDVAGAPADGCGEARFVRVQVLAAAV